jgi:hypothetical protein
MDVVVEKLSRLYASTIMENINTIKKTLTERFVTIAILMNQQFFKHMVNSV